MTLLEQIQKEHAAAFTHGGKFHADDVFSAALLRSPSHVETLFRKIMKVLFLILEEENTTITRKTAGSGKTRFRTRRLAFYGRHLAQKF